MKSALKAFAITDGLYRGTAISSNLATVASISILPGFGAPGLFLANTIQMSISGALEVPAGLIADHFGWARSTRIGLILKLLVTFAFLAAIYSAESNQPFYIWLFVTAEAVIDAFAIALLSGAYEAAYLKWYERKTGSSSSIAAPPLFLASFNHAATVRFFPPAILCAFIIALRLVTDRYGSVSPYAISYSAIFILMVLRIVVYYRVSSDLKDLPPTVRVRKRLFPPFGMIRLAFTNSYFLGYAAAVFIYLFAMFYLTGRLFKIISESGYANEAVWVGGILCGLFIYVARTLSGIILFPKINLKNKNLTFARLSLALACVALLGGSIAISSPPRFEFVTTFVMGLAIAVISDAIQRLIQSDLNVMVVEDYRATWLSMANGTGLILFGLCSAIIYKFDLIHYATSLFSLVILVGGLTSALLIYLRLSRMKVSTSARPFSDALAHVFLKSFASAFVILSLIDLTNYTTSTLRRQADTERTIGNVALESLRDPVSQGAFVEVNRRLRRLQGEGAIVCAVAEIWSSRIDLCTPESAKLKFASVRESPLLITGRHAEGTLKLHFDRSGVYNSILSRMLFLMLLFTVLSWILIKLFNRFSGTVNEELEIVLSPLRHANDYQKLTPDSTIAEFRWLSVKLNELLQARTISDRREAIEIMAAQVCHDIRSPLSALNLLVHQLPSMSTEQASLLQGAVQRIGEITETLAAHRGIASESTPGIIVDSHEPFRITHLLSTAQGIIDEMENQYKHKALAITVSADRISPSAFVMVQPGELKRILSNLISNAIDASEAESSIEVVVQIDNGRCCVAIKDMGCGIPEAVIADLGKRGVTYGKANGSGLGFWHSINTVKFWGGRIRVESTVGIGTTVTLELPLVATPIWYPAQFEVGRYKQVTVFDDDALVLRTWTEGFGDRLKCVTSELDVFAREAEASHSLSNLFIVDLNLGLADQDGIDLILRYNLVDRAVLMTHSSDCPRVLTRVEAAGIKMIPKSMLSWVIGTATNFISNNV